MPRRSTLRMVIACLVLPLAGMASRAFANPSILIDVTSGQVIESDDALHRWYPASLTKLMTTYVAFRAIQAGEVTLSSPIRISKAAAALPPSKMGYPIGSELTLDNALKIIMVKSANDVAASIGESISGSQAAFADRMNVESRRLGMKDSHWVNPHGLHDPGQYTSPRDLALLATALRTEYPQYAAYFSIEGLLTGGKEIPSHNNLIGRLDGADGMKTGYTCPAGFNLVASGTRNGRTLMAIVLGGESVASRDEKAAGMLVRGFATTPAQSPQIGSLAWTASGPNQPVDMTRQLCSKAARAAAAKKWKEEQAAIKAGLKPAPAAIYLSELNRPRKLVAVGLGGADGPPSKALEAANVYADVPVPEWRPDLPPPFARPTEQGDAAAAASVDE